MSNRTIYQIIALALLAFWSSIGVIAWQLSHSFSQQLEIQRENEALALTAAVVELTLSVE